MKNRNIIILIIIFCFIVLIAGIVRHRQKVTHLQVIEPENFDQCVLLYPIMETYPEQCQTPSGKYFTKEIPVQATTSIIQSNTNGTSTLKTNVSTSSATSSIAR